MRWPEDADGDVFLRLHSRDFDFDQYVEIDFNVDFDFWPLSSEVHEQLLDMPPDAEITAYDGGQYLLVQMKAKLTCEFVTSMQTRLSRLMARFGGRCESWGVLSEPNDNSGKLSEI